MINKKVNTSQHPSTNILKNIITNTKIPLSKYINKKLPTSDKNLSYFDKLKNMINKNQYSVANNINATTAKKNNMNNYHNTITVNSNSNNNTNMDIQYENNAHSHSYRKSYRGNQHLHIRKQLNGNNKKCIKTEMQNQKIQNKLTDKQIISQIKKDIIRKRVVSNISCNTNTNTHKNIIPINDNLNLSSHNIVPCIIPISSTKTKAKRELINYNNYIPVLQQNRNQQLIDKQLYSQICQNWGKVQLLDILGTGANATVRQAIKCKNSQKYAIKIYEKYKLLQPKKKKRVYSQINLLKYLPHHANIICMYQSFQDKRQIHVIFEYMENSITLHQYFRNNLLFLQEDRIREIFGRLVRGVAHLHGYGIAHRDIKPDNILVSFDQENQMMVKIIDFGFATTANKADLHCGTPNFMAPQLLDKNLNKYCPLAVDIWALGITLFYLCQGRYPFKGFDEKDLFRNIKQGIFQYRKIVNTDICDIINRMLNEKVEERITIAQLMECQWVHNA